MKVVSEQAVTGWPGAPGAAVPAGITIARPAAVSSKPFANSWWPTHYPHRLHIRIYSFPMPRALVARSRVIALCLILPFPATESA